MGKTEERGLVMAEKKTAMELWYQAEKECREEGETHQWLRDRYRELMVEHGHIVPGKQEPLPCGWMSGEDE